MLDYYRCQILLLFFIKIAVVEGQLVEVVCMCLFISVIRATFFPLKRAVHEHLQIAGVQVLHLHLKKDTVADPFKLIFLWAVGKCLCINILITVSKNRITENALNHLYPFLSLFPIVSFFHLSCLQQAAGATRNKYCP